MFSKAALAPLFLAVLSFASPVPDAPETVHLTTVSQNVTDASGSTVTDVAPVADAAPVAVVDDATIPNPNKAITPDNLILVTCKTSIDAKGKALHSVLGNAISGYITDPPSLGTIHKNYQWGAVYCHDVKQGAHAIYGSIYKKFKTTTNYGYPITDELTASDGSKTLIRYNNFSKKNAIYWTSSHGAHLVYGAIYARWISIGGVRSVVGYPITDELSSGTHGGRYNDFSKGFIYWHAGITYVHIGGIPSTVTLNWPSIHLGDVSGSSSIVIGSNGAARYRSHLHDSRPWAFDWSISWVLVNADGTSVSLAQHGTVGPNWGIFGSAHDSNVDKTVYSDEIRKNWRAWVVATRWQSRADTTWAWKQLVEDLWGALKKLYPYASTVIPLLV